MTQTRTHADRPGEYQMVVVLDSAVIKPGAKLSGAIFFSGYGFIEEAKMYFVGPEDLSSGRWHTGFSATCVENRFHVTQGTAEKQATSHFVLNLSTEVRRRDTGQLLLTPFSHSDPDDEHSPIFSETRKPGPPASFSYQIPKTCPPGNYKLTTVFTYFNGQNWSSNRLDTPYTVSSLFQRYEAWVAGIALTAAVFTIIAAIITIVTAGGSAMTAIFSVFRGFGR
ncbi:hypothetical protein [Achromobacter insolitus]|uniref:hypothetical protein n=1 Tax=Achromobacter insolitus TaxID=217204 RepID=UPI000A558DD7|nr:hypothetical protein [Achromobacter insolitus]